MSGSKDQKIHADRLHLVIQELLKDEDNKYCVDCDAKGPRWASWNIGVFLCIRCAGIHRNLGVHISKVKSVTLDSWTVTQLASMLDVGNSRARAIYEARLPSSFRRPQTDSALETFIRSKYEQKRYIAQDFVPSKPNVDGLMELIHKLEQLNKKSRPTSMPTSTSPLVPPVSGAVSKPIVSKTSATSSHVGTEPDLLGLDSISSQPKPTSRAEDLLSQFLIAPNLLPDQLSPAVTKEGSSINSVALPADLVGLDMTPTNPLHSTSPSVTLSADPTHSRTSKDAILALYQQQQPLQHCLSGSHSCNTSSNIYPVRAQFNPSFGAANGATQDWSFPATSPTAAPLRAQTANPLSTNFNQLSISPKQQVTTSNPSAPTFAQTPVVSSPCFATWPDSTMFSSQWSQSEMTSQPKDRPVSGIGNQSISYNYWGPFHPVPATNVPNQMNTSFSTPGLMAPNSMSPTNAAHQAYLTQVQSQLSSLQLSGIVRNAQ